MRDVYISVTVNLGAKGGKGMVQPVEATGVKSICALLNRRDWDSAWERLEELDVSVSYYKGRPVVNIAEVQEASRKWCRKNGKR